MAKTYIIANWKLHFTTGQASLFLHKLQAEIASKRDVEVVLCPSLISLQSLSLQVNARQFKLGAQNCYYQDEGAYTGEVSATQLRGIVQYVIVGHSERRHIFGETNSEIKQKVQAIVRNGLRPILCVGETKQERADGETAHVLHDQVSAGLANITSEEASQILIAYEPVWAIGTGDFAAPEQVREAIVCIRKNVKALFGNDAALQLPVLYGGSVDTHDAANYLHLDGVNGLLIGGASLKAKSFGSIVHMAHQGLVQ